MSPRVTVAAEPCELTCEGVVLFSERCPMIRRALCLLLLGLACIAGPVSSSASAGEVRYVGPNPDTGTSAAVVVDDGPLAHTAQLLPLDREGRLVGKGRAAVQAGQVLDNLAAALKEVGSDLDRAVKINVCAASPEAVAPVKKALAKRFDGPVKPAVSFVTGKLAHPDALVAMDAVAVAAAGAEGKRARSAALPGAKGGAHVAVLPAGARAYVAGQAEKGDLAEATRKTMASLRATLDFLGLKDADVVQLKAFLHPMTDTAVVEEEMVKHFGKQTVPPLVFVEWSSTLPIEIELVAAAGPANPKAGEVIQYLTPPGMSASPIYSRVARINSGKTIYVSGLYGSKAADAERQIEEIFTALGRLLDQTGSDFRHLAKATYYVADEPASRKLNELRPRYYDPRRPPAASKALVAGTGLAGRPVTLDLIAVPSPVRAEGKPEHGHGMTAKDAAAGWISLFDGRTTFGWNGARVEDGRLIGGTTTGPLPNCELRADVVTGGNLVVGDAKVVRLNAGPFTLKETGKGGPILLGPTVAVRALAVRPLGMRSLFNDKDLTGWQRIDRPQLPEERRPKWAVANGTLRASGGPGALEYHKEPFGDLVLQIEVRSCARHANGGVFFRSLPGQFMNGYEAQVHSRCEEGDPGKPARYATGGIDDRQNARRLISRDYEPFTLTVIAHGPHLATWVNGHQVTDWTDTRPKHDNPRQGLRTEAGTIQLQAHDAETDLEFRNIRAAELK